MKPYSKLTILLLAVFLVFGASCTAKEKKVQAAAEEPVDEEAIRIASIAVSQLPDDMQGNILDNMESFKADLAAVMAEESRFFIIADKSHLLTADYNPGELVSLDPQKIGEAAIREWFEYRTKGYANSYITADVKISRAQR